jgi:peptide/nickel transport system substrate-binding protein
MRRWLAALAVVLAVALLVLGLSTATGPTSSHGNRTGAAHAAAEGTVTIAFSGDPGKIDPQQTTGALARQIAEFSYDTLVHELPGGKIVSGLAEKWNVLSLTKVRFTLRSGVTCSDGTEMTALVVKKNLDYIANKANGSPLMNLFVPQNTTTVADNRKRTVTVTFPSVDPFPLQGLGSVPMVCSDGLADRGRLLNGADGSGPYRLAHVSPGATYTFELRTVYRWGPNGSTSQGMPAKVILEVITNEATAANLLLTGGLNIATISGPDRTRLEKANLFKRAMVTAPGDIWFNENTGHPTASAALRRGIVQALQLGQLGQVFTSGHGLPMTQLTLQTFTPCSGNSVNGNVPPHNEPAARMALSSHHSLKLLFASDAGPGAPAAMELAQQELDAAGASAALHGTTTANLLGTLYGSGDWDIALVSVGVSAPTQLVPFLSGATPAKHGNNFAGIDNVGYQSQVASALKTAGPTSCTHWLKAEESIFRQADLAPTMWNTLPTFANGVTFSLGDGGVSPTTLRLTKNAKS